MPQSRKILITGPPGIGKTTIIKRVIENLQRNGFDVCGFYTEEIRENNKRAGFKIIGLDGFEGILESAWVKYEIKNYGHKSFIEERCGEFGFGFFGEIHPNVLENFDLETHVCGFGVDLDELLGLVGKV